MSSELKRCSQVELLKKKIPIPPSGCQIHDLLGTGWPLQPTELWETSKVIQLGSIVAHVLLTARLNHVKVINVNV